MSELARGAPEGETPVNPYSLLEAVNRSSNAARTGWLIFLVVMVYLAIAVAGVTHKDLLLGTPVSLPLLGINIQLTQFFQFAPIVLVLVHAGLVLQLALLARETLEFDYAVGLLEPSDRRTHPLRLELNNFFFVQTIAGPSRSRVMGTLLHAMSWLIIVLLPVLLLLTIQVVFLPYHDVAITWAHRIALVIDIAMLIAVGLFLMRAETSFVRALTRTTAAHPLCVIATFLLLAAALFTSFFVATIPGEPADRFVQRAIGIDNEDEGAGDPGKSVGSLAFGSEGSLLGLFKRNLDVIDTDLVGDKEQAPGERSISLRGRDLRYAKLDRSGLRQADLAGSDLTGASLAGTDLRDASLQCAHVDRIAVADDREAARCVNARQANFKRARLEGARFTGADLHNAQFDGASLEGAELAYAVITGATFASARLEKADLSGGVRAEGTNFVAANLQGADLSGARLVGSDLSNADLRGAILSHAALDGAALREAKLEGATLYRASLLGSDLSGARIVGADLREAKVWKTAPPLADAEGYFDLTGLVMAQPQERDVSEFKSRFEGIPSQRVRVRLSKPLAALTDAGGLANWGASSDYTVWQGLASSGAQHYPDIYKARITDYLARLQCRPRWSDGAIATGVARRAVRPEFQGDVIVVHDSLASPACPAAKSVAPKAIKDLGAAADIAQGG